MKIQFIVTGWHYENYPGKNNLIDGLIELKNQNNIIDVYWACHKEPPQKIKDNFDWTLYPNLGMADGGYQQAIDDLVIEDNTLCFFIQDDIIVKDWSFINICLKNIEKVKFIGNCYNYSSIFDPNQFITKHNIYMKDFAKDSTRHLFDEPIQCLNIKGSFICCKYESIKKIDFFEPIFHYPDLIEPFYDEKTKGYRTKNEKGLGGIGNVIQNLTNYKINKVFGPQNISYLSQEYLDSQFIYECARGKIDSNNPPKYN